MEQVGILIALARYSLHKHTNLLKMDAIRGFGQHDVTAWRVVVAGNGEVQHRVSGGIWNFQDGWPTCIEPDGVARILVPVHQVVAAGQSHSAPLVQPVPSPVLIAIAVQFGYRERVRLLIALPMLRDIKDLLWCRKAEVWDRCRASRRRRGHAG